MNYLRRILGFTIALIASYYGMSLKSIIALGVLALVFIFVVLPSIFHWNKTVQRHMIFLPWVKWPKHVIFDQPENEGLPATRNFYLRTEDGFKIGVWHVLPSDLIEKGRDAEGEFFDKSLSNPEYPIVIYMHGNTGSRARDHRIALYHTLRKLNFHVIAFDYRGYADSTPQILPTKRGVVTDGRTVYFHIKSLAQGNDNIIVWGHSLGTGVASEFVSHLEDEVKPKALILESPFNNIRDEIRVHPMTWIWRKMPNFDWIFTGTLNSSDVAFLSDDCIKKIHIPIMILHAKDDLVIPSELGYKLFIAAEESRVQGSKPIKFVSFHEDLGYAHIFIHSAPEISTVVKKFIKNSLADAWEDEDYTDQVIMVTPPSPEETFKDKGQ